MASLAAAMTTAGQIFYGNPRANQVPGVTDDFQTVFYSSTDIKLDDLKQIEPRLHGIARQNNRVGRIFFELPVSERVVVAQVFQTAEQDRRGRPQFLAHALVFTKDAFRHFSNNPFVVFASFQFLAHFGEVLLYAENERSAVPNGTPDPNRWVPVVTIRRKWECGPSPDDWEDFPTKSVFQLLQLAGRASSDRRDTLAFSGSESRVRSTLKALFSIMSPEQRLQCSFDTLFSNSGETRLQSCPYSVIGVDPNWKPTIRQAFVFFSAESKSFDSPVVTNPSSTFERWMQRLLDGPGGWQRVGDIELIRAASTWWDELSHDSALAELPADVLHVNAPFWRQHIRNRLESLLTQDSSTLQPPDEWVDLVYETSDITVWRDIDASNLARLLANYYQKRLITPGGHDQKCVLQFYNNNVKSVDMIRIGCIYCRWEPAWDKLVQMLWKLPEDSRGEMVEWVLGTFKRDDDVNTEEVFRQKLADAFALQFRGDSAAAEFTNALVRHVVKGDTSTTKSLSKKESGIVSRIKNSVAVLGSWFGLDK